MGGRRNVHVPDYEAQAVLELEQQHETIPEGSGWEGGVYSLSFMAVVLRGGGGARRRDPRSYARDINIR